MTEAIAILKAQGATIVDPADIPTITTKDPAKSLQPLEHLRRSQRGKGRDANCSITFKYGMKRDFNAFLKTLGDSAPVKSLTELREWNLRHTAAGALRFGQSNLDVSDEIDLAADKARYDQDRAKDVALGGAEGIDAAMKAHQLDALLFPGAGSASIAAKPGYPTVIVPFGFVPNSGNYPAGFEAKPAPFGVGFTGMACSEPRLLELGFAFEQATKRRIAPPLFP